MRSPSQKPIKREGLTSGSISALHPKVQVGVGWQREYFWYIL
ncbi:hypothetical protein [Calothrix sp. UHCC 0171]|nr:hypothetical protein [Calothrix sp. UHCC 0171]MEA5574513.1 hypothetical protein [Calothrix sp. UHCC 0171]